MRWYMISVSLPMVERWLKCFLLSSMETATPNPEMESTGASGPSVIVCRSYIERLSQYVEDLKNDGKQVRVFHCPSIVDEILSGLPIRVGPSTSGGVILRSDTFT